jgi:peptidoglycan/xylan/chitin deacetylase (PgdA/CDA1 family)
MGGHILNTARTPVPALLFHDVSVGTPHDLWTVSASFFEQCMDLVVASGRTPVTATGLVDALDCASPAELERVCCVTSDDGFASYADLCLPVMAARWIPSTLYVTTNLLGEPAMLSADAVRALPTDLVEIGSHSVDHLHLDLLSEERARHQVTASGEALRDLLGRDVRSFAYPHGSHDSRTLRLVAEAGYANAYAVKNAFTHATDHRHALARLTVTAETTLDTVRGWLAGSGAPMSWKGQRLRTRVFREVRRVRAAADAR